MEINVVRGDSRIELRDINGRKKTEKAARKKILLFLVDTCLIMRIRKISHTGNPVRGIVYADIEIGDEPMKRAVRIAILAVGIVGTFLAAAAQQVPAKDGGPLILCPPKTSCAP